MSREYLVLIVEVPDDNRDINGLPAEIFMRFTEEPTSDFLERLAQMNEGKRVYSLLGASTWHEKESK